MKNLDLAACGVEEMNEVQMQEVDGGSWVTALKEVAQAVIVDFLVEGIKEYGPGAAGACIAAQGQAAIRTPYYSPLR